MVAREDNGAARLRPVTRRTVFREDELSSLVGFLVEVDGKRETSMRRRG